MLRLPFMKRAPKDKVTASFEDVPQLPGGACLISPPDESPKRKAELLNLYHGLFQASATSNPASVFILGVPDAEVLRRYPNAKPLLPTTDVGRVDIAPSSAMALLRALFGTSELKDEIWDIFYLEHAGAELAKAGPLAMIPSWAESQLSLVSILTVLTGLQRDTATVGALYRALMQSENFEFQLLDHIKSELAIEGSAGKVSPKTKASLHRWRRHASAVVTKLREIIDEPPLSLQLIPALREAQNGSYATYYIPEKYWTEVAPVLDVLVLSRGESSARHWLIDIDYLGGEYADAFSAASRLGAHLWQAKDNPSANHNIWWVLNSDIGPAQKKQFHHRCAQGSTFIIGPMEAVERSAINAMSPSLPDDDEYAGNHQYGVFRTIDRRYKCFTPLQIEAALLAVEELISTGISITGKKEVN